jgi:hypothetical protein
MARRERPVGARVIEHIVRIRIKLPSSCPEQALFRAVALTQRRLQARQRRELVKGSNKIIVQHAEHYVYGQTDDMLPFIQKHMSTKRHSTWLERLAASRGHENVAPHNPLTGL